MSSLMTIKLNKTQGMSWGFRLQGGKDFATPLCIQKVNVGSVAEKAGLSAGDAIVSIGGQDALTLRHKEAQDTIVRAGNSFDLVIQRGMQTWRPQVTALPEVKSTPEGIFATSTSLAATPQVSQNIGSGHNSTAAPFGEVSENQQLVNAQFNSPINLYSEDSIAETLSAQAEVLGQGVLGINFKKYDREAVLRTDSPTYRLLHGEEVDTPRKQRPARQEQDGPQGPQLPFQHDPVAQQGSQGYYNINEKLYCDVHAKQAARHNPPAPNMMPITIQPGMPAPTGAMTSPQARATAAPFQQKVSSPAPAPAPAPAPVLPEPIVQEVQVPEPAPVPERAPILAPSVPKPAPIAHAPVVAPNFQTSANPQAFGAPAGGVNVRSHIPKKGSHFGWPPQRFVQEVPDESHPPAWAPVGGIPSVPKPQKPSGPLPNRPPLLPTPPPPRDYDMLAMKASAAVPIASQAKSFSAPPTNNANQLPKFVPMPRQDIQYDDAVLKQSSSRFPNPAPSFLIFTNLQDMSNTSMSAHSLNSFQQGGSMDQGYSQGTFTAGGSGSGGGISAGSISKPRIPGKPISPPKYVPITEPMPTVRFDTVPLPMFTEPKMQTHIPKPIPIPSTPKAKPEPVVGFKAVSAPTPAKKTPSVGVKPVKPPTMTPIIMPSVPSSTISAPLPKPVVPMPPASAPAEIVAPKPVPSIPSTLADAAPAMNFVQDSMQKPGQFNAGGMSSMPKPTPMPGGALKLGGSRGVQAPGQRSAPRRGRGVMNQASASRIPICANCQRQIRGPFVSALGKTWCPDHFICGTETCRKPIIEMGFVEERGSLYCENCYESYLAPICGKCDKRIKGDCLNAVGKQFHPECFCCAYCGKVFGSGAFYLEDGLPYCEHDWNDLFTTKCVGCNFPIEAGDRWVEALNSNYHSQCFKCSKCHKNLEGQSFFAKGGKPFCKAHAQRGF